MKLIVGLGNPEARYTLTRHNVGFWMLEQMASLAGVEFASKPKFKAEVAELSIANEKVLLVKPMTYYNLSGEAVRTIADFYKVDANDILIIHDELSLPWGVVRTRIGGSDAGNNGIKSINFHMGKDTKRVRVGIDTERRGLIEDADFVLSKFTNDEIIELTKLLPKITDAVDAFIEGNFEPTTHR